MIKRHHILGLALLAVFAFSAVIANMASAETTFLLAEWLFKGAAVTSALPVETKGKLLLEDTETLLGKAAVVCEGILVGSVNANGADEVTKLLTTAGVEIALPGVGLKCEGQTLCNGTSEAWAEKLPWKTTLELEGPGGAFVDLVEGAVYTVLCGGVGVEDTCTAVNPTRTGALTNGAEDVLLSAGLASPNASCSAGKATSGVIQTIEGLTSDTEAGVLSVSSV